MSGGGFEQAVSENQFRRNDERGNADQEFREGIQAERRIFDLRAVATDEGAGGPGASPESGHERGEDGGDQGGGDAELGHGQAEPDEFVEDAAKT